MSIITVIHENPEWSAPLFAALDRRGAAYEDWDLSKPFSIDLSARPAPGVYYNRMSASAHTRGNRFAPEMAHAVLSWLDHHKATVLNPLSAVRLEVSKVEQHAALVAAGVSVPETVAVSWNDGEGIALAVETARRFDGPFISKHNRAGKGLGVMLFDTPEELGAFLASDAFDEPADGILLLQRYIKSPENFITRVEFIGRRPVYSVRVDTSEGFELCPADVCEVKPSSRPKFEISTDLSHPIIPRLQRVMEANGLDVSGFEYIVDADGKAWCYDINTNTNYNAAAEEKAGIRAMDILAGLLVSHAEERKVA